MNGGTDKATIKDIAKECGVSIATVSNVVNHTGRVSEKTVARVLETADRMGYVPDRIASNLKKRRTNVIGVITEDLTVFNTAEIVDGINEYLDEKGYSFILGNLRLYKKYDSDFYKNDEYINAAVREFRIMISQRVAGIIYICAHVREREISEELTPPLSSIAIPLSEIGRSTADIMVNMLDNEEYQAESISKLKCRMIKR